MIQKLINVLRLRDSIGIMMQNALAAILYLIFLPNPTQYSIQFIIFLVFQSTLLSYGFVINSYSDRLQDAIAGTDFGIGKFSTAGIMAMILLLGIAALSAGLLVNEKAAIVAVLALLLATFYSVRPLRLKEKGFAGALCSSLPQSALPFIFFVSATAFSGVAPMIAAWLFLKHTRNEMHHQLLGYAADKKSGVNSLGVAWGKEKTSKIINIISFIFMLSAVAPFLLITPEGIFLGSALLYFSLPDIWHTLRNLKAN